ncbi:MAG: 50S ribosomal protein L25/general stress protein Ctc [Angelakisella sp.]
MDTIAVQKRDTAVKAKQLRRSGFVPCSIFGGALKESISVQMDEPTARKLIRLKREGSKLQLDLSGQVIPVQIKEKAQNTLNNEITHISFQALKIDQKVNSVIHILLKNADKVAGALEKKLLEIPYASFPADMIDTITIDLDGMAVGSVLTVGDIPEFKSGKIDLQVDADSIVFRINDKKRAATQTGE